MTYEKVQAYIAQLNRANFGGYSDWRLPTLEEAMCLMEPIKSERFESFFEKWPPPNKACKSNRR